MTMTTSKAPVLPAPRGPISEGVLSALRGNRPAVPSVDGSPPYGDDLQLALYCCYELHYRGFHGVADDREWDPTLLGIRAESERVFLDALRHDVPAGTDIDAEDRKSVV